MSWRHQHGRDWLQRSFLSDDRYVCIYPYRLILRSTTLPFSFLTSGGAASLKLGNIFAGWGSEKFLPSVDTLQQLTIKWIRHHNTEVEFDRIPYLLHHKYQNAPLIKWASFSSNSYVQYVELVPVSSSISRFRIFSHRLTTVIKLYVVIDCR